MGKIVGGTSMLNNMVYVRGHPEDFKQWFINRSNYDFMTDVLPYFEKLENEVQDDDLSGSMYLSDLVFKSSLPDLILKAGKELNFGISDVTNCKQGFGMPKVNMKQGKRWTSSHRLLKLKNKNVFLRTNRVVEKVLFHQNFEAYGIQYLHLGKSYRVKASRGIILSAGVIGTPKILLLSGIGPKTHLDKLNIPTKVNLPVGDNLQDHITTGLDLILLNQTLGIGIEQMLSPFSVFEYFLYGTGPWTTGGCEVLAFVNTDSTDVNRDTQPDLQFMVMPLGINEDIGVHLRHLMGISDYTWNNYFSYLNQMKAMTILPILLHPKSRGTVRLRDANVNSLPIIDPGYLTEQEDIEVLLKGINLIKKLINSRSMEKLGAKLNTNIFPGCENFKFDSKAYWECYVRHLTITSYHPVGTCKMGHEQDVSAVVNYDFQVKGTNNLYVIDASVMPTITSGNVNGAVLMLAEMASDIIRSKDFFSRKKCSVIEIFVSKDFC
ncbi:glucose dehydrogenase [FAD, quinone]-like isoform X1 [Anoplophora glabripennis]|uniref:glucose dehydrogenase [FAD, quinone]-like isoform X1 n=2 Tax=Anoplophora glabripennis TaxID=217634 RepID=UPI00087381FE|nr:glucose dehydrogenase [FAD, quinone]-like isoform X1 [Anoplophora glabripennis]